MITGIRHIIFDLGGVLLNIDYKRTEEAFIDLGIADFGERYSQLRQTDLFDKLETGQINRDEFIQSLQAMSETQLSEADIIAAWNAMLLDFPLQRLQLLQQLRLHYDLILLSNTNEIHEEAFNKILHSTCGMPGMAAFFDRVYFSHRAGMRKPDAVIFQRILDECGFKAEQTLFIDDSPQHIEAADALGIRTIHLTPGMTIEKDIFLPKV